MAEPGSGPAPTKAPAPHAPAPPPDPPYWVVIFTSRRTPVDDEGYAATADRMEALARHRPGFLGIESVRGPDGLGLTVSYWADEASIVAWKNDVEHLEAQRLGIERWYESYDLRVARVERAYGFTRPAAADQAEGRLEARTPTIVAHPRP